MSNELFSSLKDAVFVPLFLREQQEQIQNSNPATEGVVVLSGHGLYDSDGNPLTWNSPENRIRISHGVKIYLEIAKKKLQNSDPLKSDLLALAAGDRPFYLYLNGEYHEKENQRNQLPDMFQVLETSGFPPELAVAQNCVINGRFNTLTQFQTINEDPVLGTASHITLVTSDYHAPRTAGTAELHLNPSINFDVAPAPQFLDEKQIFKTLEQVGGELRRIIDYSSKPIPDVATHLTRGVIL